MLDLIAAVWAWVRESWEGVIAIAALVLSIREARSARRHNKLSVRPALTITRTAMEEEPFVALELTNAGFGPARIVSFSLIFQGRQIPSRNHVEIAQALQGSLADVQHQLTAHALESGDLLQHGEKGEIVRIRFRQVPPEVIGVVLARFRSLNVDIVYESLYGERFHLKPRAHHDG